jgi:hypothetical protein
MKHKLGFYQSTNGVSRCHVVNKSQIPCAARIYTSQSNSGNAKYRATANGSPKPSGKFAPFVCFTVSFDFLVFIYFL